MASFASGIFSQAATAAQSLTGTKSLSGPTAQADSTSSTSTASASITANDFLTLLVTEMKNQDPTANTDPNEYINQLINVNSLEQLIDMNQNLTAALGTSSSSSGTTVSAQTTAAADPFEQSTTSTNNGASTSASVRTLGNLSVPNADPAAQTVAHALSGQSHAQSLASGLGGL
jgi:flagellar basal-body rod modification protein FlgD